MDLIIEAEKIGNELIELRRKFHENPELDFDLHITSEIIKEFLTKEKINFFSCAKTGIVATIYGEAEEKGDKTVAIRCDMDALPMEEKNDAIYASKIPGRMHACGHDAHMTMALGAAKVLNKFKSELKGNVKFIFEPAEETTGGAPVMIKEGALDNPKVHGIIGCHVDESIKAGSIGIKRGVAYAASNPFIIKIFGKGTHGASPHKGIDPITMTAQVINALQLLVSRETSPVSPAVITIGKINGGTAANVIPDSVTLEGIIRTMTLEDRERIKTRLKETIELQAKSLGGHCEIEIFESYPCLYNNDDMYDILYTSATKILGSEGVKILSEPTMGVESFAYFSLEVPAIFYQLGCGNKEKGITYPIHSCYFDIDEACLKTGVAVHCKAAIDFLNK